MFESRIHPKAAADRLSVVLNEDLNVVFNMKGVLLRQEERETEQVSGLMRDVILDLAGNGVRAMACLDALHLGSLKNKETRDQFREIVDDMAALNVISGIPLVGGEAYFHPCYDEVSLVHMMGLGTGPESRPEAEPAAPVPGSLIWMTSWAGHGDAPDEQSLIRMTLEIRPGIVNAFIKPIGALGVTAALFDLCLSTGMGLTADAESMGGEGAVPWFDRCAGLLVIAPPEAADKLNDLGARFGWQWIRIGVMGGNHWALKKQDQILTAFPIGREEARTSQETETEELPAQRIQAKDYDLSGLAEPKEYGQVLMALLSTPSISGKDFVYRQFDSLLGLGTVLGPGEGAAVLRLKDHAQGIAVTMDGSSRYARLDAGLGSAIAVCEAARNLVCVGARPAGVLTAAQVDHSEARKGFAEASRFLDIPWGFQCRSVPRPDLEEMYLTPVASMIGILDDLNHVTRCGFRQEGDVVVLLGQNKDEIGASMYLSVIHGLEAGRPPELDLYLEKSVQDITLELIRAGLISSAQDCAEGGLAVALAECCVAGKIGVEITLSDPMRPSGFLFWEPQSRIVISTQKEQAELVLHYLSKAQVPYQVIGVVGGSKLRITGNEYHLILSLLELEEKYRRHIECVMTN
jgi:phosphoribosylformylglycinamidine synthase